MVSKKEQREFVVEDLIEAFSGGEGGFDTVGGEDG